MRKILIGLVAGAALALGLSGSAYAAAPAGSPGASHGVGQTIANAKCAVALVVSHGNSNCDHHKVAPTPVADTGVSNSQGSSSFGNSVSSGQEPNPV